MKQYLVGTHTFKQEFSSEENIQLGVIMLLLNSEGSEVTNQSCQVL